MRRIRLSVLLLITLLFFASILAITNGQVRIPPSEFFSDKNAPILMIRMLRVFLAAIVGCGLAVSGVAMQSVLRNPLAEPYILGASSGAGLGAVIAVLMHLGYIFMPLAAFVVASATVTVVYFVARQGSRIPVQSLVLAGVIVSIAVSGIMVFLISSSPDEAIHGIGWWLWGNLEIYNIRLLFIVSAVVLINSFIIYIHSPGLNAMSLGEEEAIHLGIDIERLKLTLFISTSLITASLVCVSGVIGFVGLVIPHMMRLITGPNHRILVPSSMLGGAIFMILCDLAGRTLFSPTEIPIGVITAMAGAPLFIILLKTSQRVR